jgi:3-hydroxybutyrate dehydrogenase
VNAGTLRGRRVLVTGASRGIGFAVAHAFAAAGTELHVLADDDGIHAAAAEIAAATGAAVRPLQADIADADAVARALAAVDGLDVLVNNAGLERLTPIEDDAAEVDATFRRIVDVNVVGSFTVTRRALPKLARGGRIIFTASVWGRTGEAGFGAYVASKHAVIGLTRTLARELAHRDITVNAVCPGWVRTESSMRSLAHMARRDGVGEAALLDEIVEAQALSGLMEPADVAGIYLFLASPAASNVTGQTLNVDRGELMA